MNSAYFFVEQWPDFGCEGIKVQRAHQPTSQCQGKKEEELAKRNSNFSYVFDNQQNKICQKKANIRLKSVSNQFKQNVLKISQRKKILKFKKFAYRTLFTVFTNFLLLLYFELLFKLVFLKLHFWLQVKIFCFEKGVFFYQNSMLIIFSVCYFFCLKSPWAKFTKMM
eukprot:TRINITY_DN6767_c0_g1_i8.p3 TRINITY_DN6767_c0_g1~~TRINITY_DN6767_c0_g1_i8.p3  ORF type:complete len:167 (+),score=10.48 TRINITY_DN6767_c0_g1_i8:537-1037(+)